MLTARLPVDYAAHEDYESYFCHTHTVSAGSQILNITDDLSRMWSVQHSAPLIALGSLKFCRSDLRVLI